MTTRGQLFEYILSNEGFAKVKPKDLVSFLEKDGDYSLEGDALAACRRDMTYFIAKARQRWNKAGRRRDRMITMHQEWLNVPAVNKSLTPTVPSCRSSAEASGGCGSGTSRGRSSLSFSEKSARSKRRDTTSLVQISADKLLHAAKRRLRAEGQNDLSFVLKRAAATPTRPAKVRKLLRRPANLPVMYTAEEALRLFVDGNFTKSSWQLIRSSAQRQHANIYPSYHQIRAAKAQCCPDGITVESEAAAVPLQDLLDHTTRRLVQLQEDAIRLAANANVQQQRLQLISKWGLDGSSGHSSYKQGGVQDAKKDSSMIVTSVVTRSSAADAGQAHRVAEPSTIFNALLQASEVGVRRGDLRALPRRGPTLERADPSPIGDRHQPSRSTSSGRAQTDADDAGRKSSKRRHQHIVPAAMFTVWRHTSHDEPPG